MRLSKSTQYLSWINLATFLAIATIYFAFYILITKYLSWKMTELSTEPFSIKSLFQKKTNIGIVSMMKDPKNIETWLDKHRALGIRHFYIRLEETPELESFLQDQPDVTVRSGNSSGVNEYEDIQKRQESWVNEALQIAFLDTPQIKWLIHIDADEILQGDLDKIDSLPENVRTFWIQNHEAKYSKIPSESDNCFDASTFVDCSKQPDKCVSYGNGKGGGRVAQDVSSNGPHRMKTNIQNSPMPKLSNVIVQHYESCDFETYKKKFERLAIQDKRVEIPFPYYNESIDACRRDDDEALRKIYTKYRIE